MSRGSINLESRRVLVTGASGFIGGHLVRRLIERRCRVLCMVRATSRTDELRGCGAELLTCELTDRAAAERSLCESGAEVVFHVAGVTRSRAGTEFERVNAQGVECIASACAACAEPPALVYVSSLAAAGPSMNDEPRVETDEPRPVSAYGRSKLAGERAAERYADRVPVTIVRPPIVFGPGDQGVLQIMRPIARRGVHLMPGRGAFRVSLVHVDDLVDGLMLAAEKGERASRDGERGRGAYFIASPEHPTYAEFGRAIANALGVMRLRSVRAPRSILRCAGFFGDCVSRLRGQPTWINRDKVSEALAGSWICSSVKAREQLGWSPAAPIDARLRETAQRHREAGWL